MKARIDAAFATMVKRGPGALVLSRPDPFFNQFHDGGAFNRGVGGALNGDPQSSPIGAIFSRRRL